MKKRLDGPKAAIWPLHAHSCVSSLAENVLYRFTETVLITLAFLLKKEEKQRRKDKPSICPGQEGIVFTPSFCLFTYIQVWTK